MRRIDRCYLIAAASRKPEKRRIHLELARHYRKVLSARSERPAAPRGDHQPLAT